MNSVMYCLRSYSAQFIDGDGGLLCKSVGKSDLQLDQFENKQSWNRESDELQLTCHPYFSLTTYAFRSCEVHLFDLDPQGSIDPLSIFPH